MRMRIYKKKKVIEKCYGNITVAKEMNTIQNRGFSLENQNSFHGVFHKILIHPAIRSAGCGDLLQSSNTWDFWKKKN